MNFYQDLDDTCAHLHDHSNVDSQFDQDSSTARQFLPKKSCKTDNMFADLKADIEKNRKKQPELEERLQRSRNDMAKLKREQKHRIFLEDVEQQRSRAETE